MSVTSLKTTFNQVAETVVKRVKSAALFAENKITIMKHLVDEKTARMRRILYEIMENMQDVTMPVARPTAALVPIPARTPTHK